MNQGRLRVLLLMVTDALTLSVAWFAAAAVFAALGGHGVDVHYLTSRGGFVLIYLCINVFARLYHGNPFYPGMALPPVEEFRRLTLSTVATGALFFAYLAFYNKTAQVETGTVLLAVVLNVLVAQSARNAARRWMRRLGVGQIPVALVGESGYARRLEEHFAASSYAGVRVSVFTLVVCMPERQAFPIVLARPVEFGGFGGLEMANQLRQQGTKAAKRVAETAAAAVATALCLLPGLAIALALWACHGRRNVFYKTVRLGKRGRPFVCWKFRTMVPDAERRLREILEANPALEREWRATGKLRRDPRVTRIGAWLRKTSLDEIPQLINVFRREMALIGPRPIIHAEVPRYGRAYDVVSAVKPGITGLWQVSGRSDVDYETRVALDSFYAQNWSLWLDFWIFLRTFAVVLFQRGAY